MLEQHRQTVAEALAPAEVTVVEYTTAALTPPVVAVVPGQPYLSWGERTDPAAFAFPLRVRLDLLLLTAQTGDAKADARLIDRLIDKVVPALSKAGIAPTRVSRPGKVTIDGGSYMGAVVNVQHDTAEPNPE